MHQKPFGREAPSGPTGGADSAATDPLAGLRVWVPREEDRTWRGMGKKRWWKQGWRIEKGNGVVKLINQSKGGNRGS